MVGVRRSGAHWALFSPVELDDASRRQLTDAGEVEALVVPTAFHNTGIAESCEAFPGARAYLTRGVRRRALPADRCHRLSEGLPPEWAGEIEPLPIDGMPRVNEVALLHPASGTLIVSDLCFNLDRRYPLATRMLFGLFGVASGLGISRLFRAAIRDRPAFLRSLDRILDREFDRLVMSHGAIVETGAREALAGLRRGLDRRAGG